MFFSCFRHQIVVYLPRNTSARFLTLKGIEYEKFKKMNLFTDILCPMNRNDNSESLRLNNDEVKQLYDLGIRRFKIQGRGEHSNPLLDIMYYLYGTQSLI